MNEKSVSIVMCTFNGEKFVRQQMETLLQQTYPIHEIIVQDDHSTDKTMEILLSYAQDNPKIKIFTNEKDRGVNNNFFSAMRRATGEYIAISDQDDLWEPTKIEKQVTAIKEHLLCVCRSKPFSSDNSPVSYDARTPNYHLIRLLYASIPGHVMLFHRRLLDLLPPLWDYDYKTYYDVFLSLTAASYGSLILVDEFLVHQRRYIETVTFTAVDKRRSPSTGNALYILGWSLLHFQQVRPHMHAYFQRRLRLLRGINASGGVFEDAVKIVSLEGEKNILSLLRLCKLHLKYRHYLFYAEGQGCVNFIRASLYCIMQIYNYRYLIHLEK